MKSAAKEKNKGEQLERAQEEEQDQQKRNR